MGGDPRVEARAQAPEALHVVDLFLVLGAVDSGQGEAVGRRVHEPDAVDEGLVAVERERSLLVGRELGLPLVAQAHAEEIATVLGLLELQDVQRAPRGQPLGLRRGRGDRRVLRHHGGVELGDHLVGDDRGGDRLARHCGVVGGAGGGVRARRRFLRVRSGGRRVGTGAAAVAGGESQAGGEGQRPEAYGGPLAHRRPPSATPSRVMVTRRLSARPSSVLLLAIGSCQPRPSTLKVTPGRRLDSSFSTARARFSDRVWL